MLNDGLFEIDTEWGVIGNAFTFEDLIRESEVIGGIRYNKLNFLLRAEKVGLVIKLPDLKTLWISK